MKFRYIGGVQSVDVVLGETVLTVASGETVDVTGEHAKRLEAHPEFVKVKGKGSSSSSSADETTTTDPDPDELDTEPGNPKD